MTPQMVEPAAEPGQKSIRFCCESEEPICMSRREEKPFARTFLSWKKGSRFSNALLHGVFLFLAKYPADAVAARHPHIPTSSTLKPDTSDLFGKASLSFLETLARTIKPNRGLLKGDSL